MGSADQQSTKTKYQRWGKYNECSAFRRTNVGSNSSVATAIQQVGQTKKNSFKVKQKNWKNDDDDDDTYMPAQEQQGLISFAHILHLSFRLMIGATVTFYVLNQKHLLPKPISSVVSRTLFWPTLPITVSRRLGSWVSNVDDTVVMGGAPFGFCHIPEKLHDLYGVRSVINMCEEYSGPTKKYEKLGMKELRLKTVDHFEPSLSDLKIAVSFIQSKERENTRVYVHCRAGHGRSAAVALAWLIYKNPQSDPETLNKELCRIRNVRKTLWKQPNIKEFYSFVKKRD